MLVNMNNMCLIIKWLIFFSCYKNTIKDTDPFSQGNNPNFKIICHFDEILNPLIEKLMFLGSPFTPTKRLKISNYSMQQT